MIPVVTPREMAEVDAAAAEPVDKLIERAGAAVAWAARQYLGGLYGRRVAVIVGQGNNGSDGRVAARRLRAWGARVVEVDPRAKDVAPEVNLVIDAAYGTGLSRPYTPPVTSAPVIAVDIPSGVDGLTGELLGEPLQADSTVTFQALKPGLLFVPGADYAGAISVVDLGLDVSSSRAHLLESSDVSALLPTPPAGSHKWRSACWVIAGSSGMTGAATLASSAAGRAGAGYVRLSVPGAAEADGAVEAVRFALPAEGWGRQLADVGRFGAVVVGPGLGRVPSTMADVRLAVAAAGPVVVDGDALAAFAESFDALTERTSLAVLTPHDGEFELLTGARPGPDRIGAARVLAARAGSVVLLKGPTTVVAAPDGQVILSTTGDSRLATAGTGDVLAGMIGALLAQGLGPLHAAAVGAQLHGCAAARAPRFGMVASDLLPAIPEVLHETYLG